MIKRTLYFGNPAYLNIRLAQLEIRQPEIEKNVTIQTTIKDSMVKRIPIEDIGVVILDNNQITITTNNF
jgi:CRISPR-associated protein Cas1